MFNMLRYEMAAFHVIFFVWYRVDISQKYCYIYSNNRKSWKKEEIMENIYGMIPLAVFTLLAVMYHVGHKEYDKHHPDS